MQFTETHEWIEAFGAHYALGVDGIGLTLVLLTAILTPVVMLASWHDGDDGRWGTNALLRLDAGARGRSRSAVFAAPDVFLFYVAVRGHADPDLLPDRRLRRRRAASDAAVKFLLYTLAGGLVMLASVVGLYVVSADAGRPDVPHLASWPQLDIGTDDRALAVPRLLHRLRDQGADVPGAHLAARHHRGGHPRHLRCCWSACSTRSAPSA